MQTAIQPDIAEAAAHKAAVARGEISLERPQGVNVKGRPDFITAARDSTGKLWIMVNDAKASGAAPPPKDFAPAAWDPHVKAAVARADVGNAALNAEIKAAYAAGRVRLRQIDVDYTPSGQGRIGGLSAPPPVPWGPMVRPVNFDVDLDDVEDE